MSLSSEEADAIATEEKLVSGNIDWRQDGRGFRMSDVLVLAPSSGTILRLKGWIGPVNRSFALLYKNQPIRKWTVHSHHRLPSGEVIYGAHKHTWDEDVEDQWAYVPDDIMVGDPNEELRGFLRECKIQVLGGVQTVGLRG